MRSKSTDAYARRIWLLYGWLMGVARVIEHADIAPLRRFQPVFHEKRLPEPATP